jgi:hypothetical protein
LQNKFLNLLFVIWHYIYPVLNVSKLQELPTLLEHVSSLLVFSGLRVVLCYLNTVFLVHLTIVLSVLRFTASHYPFGVFLHKNTNWFIGNKYMCRSFTRLWWGKLHHIQGYGHTKMADTSSNYRKEINPFLLINTLHLSSL